MDYGFKGKVAIVTGAAGAGAGGTGLLLAQSLAKMGASVIMTDINESGNDASNQLNQEGFDTVFYQMDLEQPESINEFCKKAIDWKGKVDILINCAFYIGSEGLVEDTTLEMWEKHFNINMRGNFLMIKNILPVMKKNNYGSIVNISSIASLLGEDGSGAYSACKAALNSFTRTVATQYGEYNIRCNTVIPGSVLSDGILEYSKQVPAMEFQFDQLKRHSLLKRFGKAEDVTNAVLFLASDLAKNITGQQLVTDAGYTAHSAMWADINEYKKHNEWNLN